MIDKKVETMLNETEINELCKKLQCSEQFRSILIHENIETCYINTLPVTPYYKVVDNQHFKKFSDKIDRMHEIMSLIDVLSIEQSEIVYRRNKIPCVIEYKKHKSVLNQYVLEYESLKATCEHIAKLEVDNDSIEFKPNKLGFKIQKHTPTMSAGAELQQVRLNYRMVLSHLIYVTNEECDKLLQVVESNTFYQKCVSDYNLKKVQKAELRRELTNIKKVLSEVRVSPKCVLFSSEERDNDGKIKVVGLQWVADTYKSKRIITY